MKKWEKRKSNFQNTETISFKTPKQYLSKHRKSFDI